MRQCVEVRGIHHATPLVSPKVMRSEETSNARSSLGYSAIDVKRFLRRFSHRGLSYCCCERWEGLAVRVPMRKLHLAIVLVFKANKFVHLLVHFQAIQAAVPIHLSGTPLAL
jgi:hypothetical protein